MEYVNNLPEDGSTYKQGFAYEAFVKAVWKFNAHNGTISDELSIGDTGCKKEIKYDRKMHQTGNLFIEWSERPLRSNKWHKAATFVDAKYLMQGDCHFIYMIPTEFLLEVVKHRAPPQPVYSHGRSTGWKISERTFRTKRAKEAGCRGFNLGNDPLAVGTERVMFVPDFSEQFSYKQQDLFNA